MVGGTKLNSVTFYDKVSNLYNQPRHEFFYRTIAKELILKIPNGFPIKTILEVGSGTGFSTLELKSRYPEAKIAVVEPSLSMLSRAKDKMSGIEWHAEFFSNFSSENKHDLVVSSMVSHWLDEGEIEKLFRTARNSMLAIALPVNSNDASKLEQGNYMLKQAILKVRPKNNWPKETRSPEKFLKVMEPHFDDIETYNLVLTEKFSDIKDFFKSLYIRGVLMALFGSKAEEAKRYLFSQYQDKSISFKWYFKLIIAN